MPLVVPELPDILVAVGNGKGALAIRPTRIDHVGITGWQSALPIGWHGQTNEKEKHGTHRLSLTKSHKQRCGQTKKGRTYRLGLEEQIMSKATSRSQLGFVDSPFV